MAYGSVLTDVVQSSTAGAAPTFKDGNGTQIGTLCRAWVNFNGTGTVAIRGSFNVSSITDNGTGLYTVNFTNAMPDANYSAVGSVDYASSNAIALQTNTYLAGSLSVSSVKADLSAYVDKLYVNVAVFR